MIDRGLPYSHAGALRTIDPLISTIIITPSGAPFGATTPLRLLGTAFLGKARTVYSAWLTPRGVPEPA